MTGDAAGDGAPGGPGGRDGEDPTGPSCGICGRDAGAWLHRLDGDRARFDVYGKPHVWASEVALCDRCERLYRDGDDEALAAVHHERTADMPAEDVAQLIRTPLAALRAADTGAIEVARWLPPGAAGLAAEGFVPVEYLSGGIDVPRVWPAAHRRSVPETREGLGDGDGLMWLVRSPWPALPVTEAVSLMWDWVENPDPGTPTETHEDVEWGRRRSRDFLHREQEWVLAYRRGRG